IYKAIDAIVQRPTRLLEFSVHAVTEGIDALGEVTVRLEAPSASSTLDAQKEQRVVRTFGGYGADTDIIVASAKAYLAAMNKVLVESTAAQSAGPQPSAANAPSDLPPSPDFLAPVKVDGPWEGHTASRVSEGKG
ncbi:MAG TPA: alpha-isopropylmalate synthase regulatory domain-containing protein, partial [Bacteroidota bacterium]